MHQDPNRTECSILLQLFQLDCANFNKSMMSSKSKDEKIDLIKNYTEKTDNYLHRWTVLGNLLDPRDPFRDKLLNSIPMIDFNNSDLKNLYERYLNLPPDSDPLDFEK